LSIVVTKSAGSIGSEACEAELETGDRVGEMAG
jgi:hypothetical protein